MNSIAIFQLGCALRLPLELGGMERNLIRFDAKGKGWQKLARWGGLVKKYPRLAEVVQVKTSLSDWKVCSSFLLGCLAKTQDRDLAKVIRGIQGFLEVLEDAGSPG
ncbi:hypothetical protein FA13DRAFT_552077 [Coprinellus micaceus]|uniref:Uncharacterized protein n=1 Tax=Coprinellus micaceus TaxID=71717 RepID=A0A4Y7T8E1_COPMI|nr:hypothetical protein FA13DRAFT_552077 [Coprinellus micaceus]